MTIVVATVAQALSARRLAGSTGRRSCSGRRKAIGAEVVDRSDSKVTFEWTIVVMLKINVCCTRDRSCKGANSLGIDCLAILLIGIGDRSSTTRDRRHRTGSMRLYLRRLRGTNGSCGSVFKVRMRSSAVMVGRSRVRLGGIIGRISDDRGPCVADKFAAFMNCRQVITGKGEERQCWRVKRRLAVKTGLLFAKEFLDFVEQVLTDRGTGVKTTDKDGSPKIVRAHLGPEIAGIPMKNHLLNCSDGFHMELLSVGF